MMELDRLVATTLTEITQCYALAKLTLIKKAVLGKDGSLTKMVSDLKRRSVEDRRKYGGELNSAKETISKAIQKREYEIEKIAMDQKLREEYIDVTMPPRLRNVGKIHPLTKTTEEISGILSNMGFSYASGPDIENDFFNFTALNIPEHHPARTMHDTFYVNHMGGESLVLRTHTSSVEARVMRERGAPLYIFSIGRTYRSDSDATHTPMFHQIECVAVDQHANFANLQWAINEFLKKFFKIDNLNMRLRPSFFPFTEPSAEVDIAYESRNGIMTFGTGSKWLEVLGCGVLHPRVLELSGINPKKYQGFAFGMGLERLTSLKYGIPDLRRYFDYDKRFENSFYFDHC